MDLTAAICISLGFGVLVLLLMNVIFRISLISSICLGLLSSYILLNMMYPIGILMYERNTYIITSYLLIEIAIPTFLFIYLVIRLLKDTREITLTYSRNHR